MTRQEHERRERLVRAHLDAMQDFADETDRLARATAYTTHRVLKTFRAVQDFYSFEMS